MKSIQCKEELQCTCTCKMWLSRSIFLKLALGCHLFTKHFEKSKVNGHEDVHVLSYQSSRQKQIIRLWFFLSSQRSDEPEENGKTLAYEEGESLHGKEKRRKENENLNGRATEQPSKKRKEDSSSIPQLNIKRASPEKKVCEFVHRLFIYL